MPTNINIMNAYPTQRRIQAWTWDTDNIYSTFVLLGAYVEFSNVPYPGAKTKPDGSAYVIGVDYPIPIRLNTHVDPVNHAAYFDNQPLSARSEDYQEFAINWFAETLVGGQLNPQKPSGNYPDDGANKKLPLSERAINMCLKILSGGLEDYLAAPFSFVTEYFGPIDDSAPDRDQLSNEINAFTKIAEKDPGMVREAYNVVELGRAEGDHDVYILIGVDPKTRTPDHFGMEWYMSQIENFAALNGFLPDFGYFISEASRRYRVVLGPGVTEREKQFLETSGHHITDMRNGEKFEKSLPNPFDKKDKSSIV